MRFVRAGVRANEHPVAAAFVCRFHYELLQIIQDEFPVIFVRRKIGFDIRKNRFLAQVEFDHFGNIVVGDLVICDASADGICEVHIPLAVSFDDARNAQRGILPENRGIDEIIVDAAIDDIDLPESLGRLHEDPRILHEKIAAGDNFDPHRTGEKGMFEICGIVDSRREDHYRGIRVFMRSDVTQDRK